MKTRLYYSYRKHKYLLVIVSKEVCIEHNDTYARRYLRDYYRWPSSRGFKFIGEVK